MMRGKSSLALGLCWLTLACSGRNDSNTTLISAGAGGVLGAAGTSAMPTGGMSAGGAGQACRSATDCVQHDCETTVCDRVCSYIPDPAGTPFGDPVSGDCQVSVCDGFGKVVSQLAPNDAPASTVPCMRTVCNEDGTVGGVPVPAGTKCDLPRGSGVCDGKEGVCFECLVSSDCGAGQVCMSFGCKPSQCATCGASTCKDQVKDGDETDVDCGGSCAQCPPDSACAIDQDCDSDVCHPLTRRCEQPYCVDQKKDGDESDVDCGGFACTGCYIGKHCNADTDCATGTCSAALGNVCNGNPCADKIADGDESDVDCGGATCGPCHAGQRCASPYDCDTYCDPATLRCTQ